MWLEGRAKLSSTAPRRIVSLVPSITELLVELGLGHKILGRTKFCVHPHEIVHKITKIGGTKNINTTKIEALEPDLVICNKEENVKTQIEQLGKHIPVWLTEVVDYNSALKMILDIGEVCHTKELSLALVETIKLKKENLELISSNKKRILYLIWQKPFMSVGGDTYIHSMLKIAGFTNVMESFTRYPEITAEDINQFNPDYIFLSSEPYPFQEKHLKLFQKQFPSSQPTLVDGEMFSWYGSRMKYAFEYFSQLRKENSIN